MARRLGAVAAAVLVAAAAAPLPPLRGLVNERPGSAELVPLGGSALPQSLKGEAPRLWGHLPWAYRPPPQHGGQRTADRGNANSPAAQAELAALADRLFKDPVRTQANSGGTTATPPPFMRTSLTDCLIGSLSFQSSPYPGQRIVRSASSHG